MLKSRICPNMKDKQKSLQSRVRFSNGHLVVFCLAFAVIGGIVLWRSFAAPPPPTIYLNPAAQTFGPNTSFSIQIRENSGTTPVNAVQANLSYSTTLLTLVSIDTTGTAFGVEAQNTGANGSINLARGTCGGCAAVTGDQLVATLNFRTNATSGTATVPFTAGTALVSASSNTDILSGLGATGSGSYTADITAPTVSVTAPANGATIGSGSTVNVTVSASDAASSITRVEVLIDGALASTLTSSPYTYPWSTTGLSLGNHTVQARAYDTFNNVGTSTLNTVTVADQTPPTTSVTSPNSGAILRGTVTVNANAADNTGGTGISRVELFVDNVLRSTDTTTPYSFSWDTTAVTNASHSLTVKAYDGATPANLATSTAVIVTVDNSAPTTPLSLRMTSNTLTSINLAWNASADNNAVTGYQLSRNGVVLTTVSGSTLTYNDTSLLAGTSYNYSVIAQDAAGNSSFASTLTTATLTPKLGDLNGDNLVNVVDLSILLSNFNTTNSVADVNKDGFVNIIDLSILLSRFGT